jgi:hypothetical protein
MEIILGQRWSTLPPGQQHIISEALDNKPSHLDERGLAARLAADLIAGLSRFGRGAGPAAGLSRKGLTISSTRSTLLAMV